MTDDPYLPPAPTRRRRQRARIDPAGFWIRVAATIIDVLILMVLILPLLAAVYGTDYFLDPDAPMIQGPVDVVLNYVVPALYSIGFWVWRAATPGKLAVHIKVVNAQNGGPPSVGQCIVRFIGYYISALVLGLGYLWVAWDPQKRGWHDHIAGTRVDYDR